MLVWRQEPKLKLGTDKVSDFLKERFLEMGHHRLFDPDKGYNVLGETLNYFLTLGIKISNLRIFNTGRRVLITRFKSKNI